MTEQTDSDEIVNAPGIQVSWALQITDEPAEDPDAALYRTPVDTLVAIEQIIAARIDEFGDAVDRVIHTFRGREIHLRDGAVIQFRWQLVVSDWRCRDCSVDTSAIDEYYMVNNEVWESADADPEGHLCVGCLERRLGRTLTASDFTDLPINTTPTSKRSPRLLSRLAMSETANRE